MSSLSSCWRNELRLFWRSRWLPVALTALPMMALLYQIIMLRVDSEHPTGWLSLSAHISLVGMLMFMLLGLTSSWRERRANCDEVMHALPGSVLLHTGSKLLALLAVWGSTCFATVLVLFPMVWSMATPAAVYGESCLFLLMYWFLPWLICTMMGLLIGMMVHSKLAYPLVLLIWLLTSPINMGFFRIIMMALGGAVDLRRTAYLFNLSIFDPQQGYNPTYGFPLEQGRWASRFLCMAAIGFLLFAIASVRSRAVYRRTAAVVCAGVLAIGIPSAVVAVRPSQLMREYHDPLAAGSYDSTYYETHSNLPDIASSSVPQVQAYDMTVDTRRGQLEATVKMTAAFSGSIDEAWFTLYRDLLVDKVTVEGSDIEDYTQTGDYLHVPLAIGAQRTASITLHYAGVMSPFMYANDQAVMLPAFFPWYPRAGVNPVMLTNRTTSGAQLLAQPAQSASYTVTYSGPQPSFSNLPKEGDAVFSGTADGMTLMAGTMASVSVDGATVVYPKANYPSPAHFSAMLRQLKEQRASLASLFPEGNLNLDTVFLVSNDWPVTSDNSLWAMTDHTVLSISGSDWQGLFLEDDDWRSRIVSAWTRGRLKSGGELPVYSLFQNAFADYLAIQDGTYAHDTANLTTIKSYTMDYDENGDALPEEQWKADSRKTYQAADAMQAYLEANAHDPKQCKRLIMDIDRTFSEASISLDSLQAGIDHVIKQKEG